MKYQKLLSEFEGQLDQLDHGGGDILFRAEKGIVLMEKVSERYKRRWRRSHFLRRRMKSISSNMSSPRSLVN